MQNYRPSLRETAFNPWSPALYNFLFNVTLVRKIMVLKGELKGVNDGEKAA